MDTNTPKTSESVPAAKLRRIAEQRLRDAGDAEDLRLSTDARALVHELQVHQIELQMQNEELERTRTEAQQALDKYYDLFDFAPVGYFLWEPDGRILEVNLAGAALIGLDRDKAGRHRFVEFVATEHHEAFVDFLKRVLITDAKQTCQIRLLRDGRDIFVLIEGIAAHDRQKPGTLCRAAVVDVTQHKRADELAAANQSLNAEMAARKQVEVELRAAKESAEAARADALEANRAKDQFLATLSHELRTPLTPVIMGVAMLHDRRDLDPAVRDTLEMVRRNVEMEARLIDDLLDVARIARGTIVVNRAPADLCAILERALEVCKPDIEARGLNLAVDLGSQTPCWIEADPARLQQVFWNLLKNAVKFTPFGGSIRLRCRSDRDHVVIEVGDNGIGITADALPRVFNAFEQADRDTSKQFGGLGLGLAISKTIVEMHGGTISAHSPGRDQGATFHITLPLSSPPSRTQPVSSTHSNQSDVPPLRILLVEDHGVTAQMMKTVLSAEGHTVETAGDVATALQLAHREPFDLLLSDLGLPDSTGHDLMRQLRRDGLTLPGIALSGYGRAADIRASYEAGFAAHLTKPASREAVLTAIAAATSPSP
ncbi:MAG: hybrid sensor histidine kinase/response regulator [Thermoguttaceae bacterium]